MTLLFQCLCAFAATMGFGIVFNIRGKYLLLASLGGTLGWFIYSGLAPYIASEIPRYCIASVGITFFSEMMARIFKTPATLYLPAAIIPLVPGGGIYYTMENCVNGEVTAALNTGIHTFGIAGSMAIGIMMVPAFLQLIHLIKKHFASDV